MLNKLLLWNNRFTKLSMGKVFSDPSPCSWTKIILCQGKIFLSLSQCCKSNPWNRQMLEACWKPRLVVLRFPLPSRFSFAHTRCAPDRGQPGPRCQTVRAPKGSANLQEGFFTGGTECLGMPWQDVGTHHVTLFVCSLPRRGSDVLCGSCIFAGKFLLSWLLKGWFFLAQHQTTARPLQHGAQLSKVPEHTLTCELMLPSTEKAFKTKPRASVQCSWHHRCAIQPSTSFLHSSVQICPFLPNSTPWPVYPPAHARFRVQDSDAPIAEYNHAWWFCSIKDR